MFVKYGEQENIGSNCTTVKNTNQLLIIDELRTNGSLSRSDLAKRLHLSNPSISKNVEDLKNRGILIETGPAITDLGRRPVMLRFNENCGCVIAISFTNQDGAYVCLSNLDGRFFETVNVPGEHVFDEKLKGGVLEAIRRLLSKYSAVCGKLMCICIACPGIIDPYDGHIIYALQIPDSANIDFNEIFGKEFGVPVVVKNDVNLAASGEHSFGAGKGCTEMLYVYINQGIAGGLILRNELYEGVSGYSGEIGLIKTEIRETSSYTDEQYFRSTKFDVTSAIIIEKIAERFDAGEPTVLRDMVSSSSEITLEHVNEAVKQGDRLCCSLIGYSARVLASLLLTINQILDLELFVLAGTVELFGDFYINAIKQHFASSPLGSNVDVTFSKLGDMASVYGGVNKAIEVALENLVE